MAGILYAPCSNRYEVLKSFMVYSFGCTNEADILHKLKYAFQIKPINDEDSCMAFVEKRKKTKAGKPLDINSYNYKDAKDLCQEFLKKKRARRPTGFALDNC